MATAQWETVPPNVDAMVALKELAEILKAQAKANQAKKE